VFLAAVEELNEATTATEAAAILTAAEPEDR
jgi:hypothetical protein